MPKKRIPRSQLRGKEMLELRQKFEEGKISSSELAKGLIEIGMKRFIEEVLEEEVSEYLGREYYERGNSPKGYRNGYKQGIIRSGEGKIVVDRPQVSDSQEIYRSKIWPYLKGRTEKLERLAVEMYVRGCSVRDIEDILRDKEGKTYLSHSVISQLTKRLWEEYNAFLEERLEDIEVVYIYCDAVYESMRIYKGPKEGILVVWAVVSDGRKKLLTLELGNKESYGCWQDIFRRLKERGLNEPVLGVSDGAPGLIKAFEEAFPNTLRQRCLVHKKKNILDKVPEKAKDEVKSYLNSVYNAADEEMARINAEVFRKRFGEIYPSAVRSFEEDFEACIAYLRCPERHRKHICTNNMIERTFLEEKRRTKIIPRFFDEKSCLALSFGVLMRAEQRWRKIPMNFDEQVKIMELREKLGQKTRYNEVEVKSDQRVHCENSFSRKKWT